MFNEKNNTNKARGGVFESMAMNEIQESTGDILPPNPIRVETALSRYPVHRLARRGDISIDISETDESGELSTKWEVTYNSKYGQPGPLAYKLDTLIINRRIEEVSSPGRSTRKIPKIIKLGGIREIIRELGHKNHDAESIKNALYQNAGALITPRIRYQRTDGSEETLETGFTRYSVAFTGQKLPDGRKADAIYIILNDIYMQVLNGAMTRPLDYDYLKSLPPAPQRFYEMLSYRMYAAIKNDRPRAKLLYSTFCTYAPQTRYVSFDKVKKQMYKVHTHHRKSGYIAKIDYEQTVDNEGQPDWLMLYQPGPKARADYRAFQRGGGPVMLEAEPLVIAPPALPALQQPSLPLADPEPSPTEVALIGQGISPAQAAELARKHDAATIDAYIEYLEWEKARKPEKIKDDAAWLYTAIRDGRRIPKAFVSRAERQRREEEKQAKQRAEAEERRRKQAQTQREDDERKAINVYWDSLTPEQKTELEAAALAEAGESARQTYETMKRMRGGPGYLALICRDYIQRHDLHNQRDRQIRA